MERSLFGLRFKSNEALQPNATDLSTFLGSPRAPGSQETHRDDLAVFLHYLSLVEHFETGPYQGLGRQDFGERLLISALSHTRFYRPALRIAVEEYKYHHHQLLQPDFGKPEKFIRSAGEELRKLDPKKRDDQQKIARLQALIDQRKKDLGALTRHRRMLTGELCHIAVYVRDNIVMVQQLCEDAIARLVKLQVGGEKTGQLIEDIKAHFKDQVREHRQLGTVTPEYLESVKAEVAQLSQRLTQLVLGDIAAVAGMFEELYEYAKKNSALLSELIGRAERARKDGTVRDNQAFTRLERVLVALISEFRPDVKAPAQAGAGERHGDLLRDRRKEMLDHIFQTLREQRKDDGWRA